MLSRRAGRRRPNALGLPPALFETAAGRQLTLDNSLDGQGRVSSSLQIRASHPRVEPGGRGQNSPPRPATYPVLCAGPPERAAPAGRGIDIWIDTTSTA